MEYKHIRVSIISFPVGQAFVTPLSNLVNIFCDFSSRVNVVVGCVEDVSLRIQYENVRVDMIDHKGSHGFLASVAAYALTQARLSRRMLHLSKDTDIYVFIGQGPPLASVIAAKLAGKRILWILPSSLLQTARLQKHRQSLILAYLLPACYFLSDRLIVYSDRLVSEWGLDRYRNKISIAYEHYVDISKFRVTKDFREREDIIGYVGRLSPEKGIQDLLKAIPAVLEARPGIKFLIVGNGPLEEQVMQIARDQEGRVKAVGWVSHDDLPAYYNEMKLLILPSYTEGLPNVLLEAMACGTSVLATPVGATPDIVIDGLTGFILKNNSPEAIAEAIAGALDYPEAGRMAGDASDLIGENYVYAATVRKFKKVLCTMVKDM